MESIYYIKNNDKEKYIVTDLNNGNILKRIGCQKFYTKQIDRLTSDNGKFHYLSQEETNQLTKRI